MEAAGLGDLMAGPPMLCEWSERARHCWVFCGGWNPQVWPVYDSLHDVSDWAMLIELMQEIRDHG